MILAPLTPSELLRHLIANTTHPTSVVIGWSRDQFTDALVEDVEQSNPDASRPLLQATLLQTAISRHISLVFTPTVAHLRAHLATFSASKSRIPAPPRTDSPREPLLIVYGLLEIHRDGLEWSAQGLGLSAATFVESATKNKFRAVAVEPRRTADKEAELQQLLRENMPVLTGTPLKDDGSWSGPIVPVSNVLCTWFGIHEPADET
jgi:hypothetical protein